MIRMDEKVEKILRENLTSDDYEMVLEMLEVLESSTKNPKNDIRKILEDTIHG